MTMPKTDPSGLTGEEAKRRQQCYGKNELTPQKKQGFFKKMLHIVSEPMFLLLIAAAVIYFLLGEMRDGAIMLVFVVGIITIDIVQEWKTDKTLNALKDLSAPHITVIRDGAHVDIPSVDLVPGDLMLIQEGVKIPADGYVQKCADLRVDESTLTGEAEQVWKVPYNGTEDTSDDHWRKDYCYAGTLCTQGTGTIVVDRIAADTEYGKIGANVAAAPQEDTPLKRQIGRLVKFSALFAAALFILVGFVTYLNIPDHAFWDRLIESILSGITLAMAMIPEEFPVVLTVFLSMGAWRLAKNHALVRQLPAAETLGAVSVLCVDKTGTITQNRMRVQQLWAANGDEDELCEIAGLACESETYDPMEQAILSHCEKMGIERGHLFGGEIITEYAFTNELKMMGHVWQHDGEIIMAAKGSPERIFELCQFTDEQRQTAQRRADEMSAQGLRVIAVGIMKPDSMEDIPDDILQSRLMLSGLVGLADPPRENVKQGIQACRQAGIRMVMITGDNGITARSIAQQVGMDATGIITGKELDDMSDETLCARVKTANIFARVVPAHKMRIVKALRDNGDVVAMTGDGVNDAPALKYADIGIAMGKRGSEVSREAADMILMDDNFSTIVDTVRDGRRIYDNIKKAVGYIFSIHIPIALSSLLAPMLGVDPVCLLLLPLHVVLLELMIDPTCSIVLERQPAESDIMRRPPRDANASLINAGMLAKSVALGLTIFAASFGAYYVTLLQSAHNAPMARSMGIAILLLSNLLLVQVLSSEREPVTKTFKRQMRDRVMWFANLITLLVLALALYTPLGTFLKLAPLSAAQAGISVLLAVVSVFWVEILKWMRRRKNSDDQIRPAR